jgi:hypothetical protein
MNRGDSQIVDMVGARQTATQIQLIETMENTFFGTPDASDSKLPFGLLYYIVKNASEGFNGGAAAGFTTVAGVNLTNYPKYKNYTVAYTDVSADDLVSSLRTMARKTNFKSPVDVTDFREGRGQRYRIYLNESTIKSMENLAIAQNDNLGRDLAPMDDMTAFKKNPLVYVPKLDDDASNPLYFVDLSVFYPVVLRGNFFRETVSAKSGGQHNVTTVHTDLTYNYLCVDRRRTGVAYVA